MVLAEAYREQSELEFRRVLDLHEMLPLEDLHQRIAERYGIAGQDLFDLASGDKIVEPAAAASKSRGLFEDSTATYLDAAPADAARADRYLYYECHTAAFESVGHRGHAERLEYEIDQLAGDAFITPDKQFGETYLMDLAQPTYKWRARLSFIEWYNNEAIAELTRRGTLQDYVIVEHSLFPYHAETQQAHDAGYNLDTYKSFIRTSWVDDSQTKRTIDTLSYSDMLPADVQLLRAYFGLPQSNVADAESILREPLIIPKSVYREIGEIGGLAQLVDRIKQQRDGNYYRFGEVVDAPVQPEAYANVMEVSALRKANAEPVIRSFMQDILSLAQEARSGAVSSEARLKLTGDLILKYRLELLKNDASLATEQFGLDAASQIEQLVRLESQGRSSEATLLAVQLQDQFGTAYICGMAVQVDQAGNAVDGKKCEEIKNGDKVTCPNCGQQVEVKVEANGIPYCTDKTGKCKLMKSGDKGKVTVEALPKAEPPRKSSATADNAASNNQAAAGQTIQSSTIDSQQVLTEDTAGNSESIEVSAESATQAQPAELPKKIGAIALNP